VRRRHPSAGRAVLWFSWIVVGIGACSGNDPNRGLENMPVAMVNGEPIKYEEYHAVLQEIKDAGKGFFVDEENANRAKRNVLEQLIDARLLLQEARRIGVSVDPSLVDAAVMLATRQYPPGESENTLRHKGKTMAQYRKETSEHLLQRKLIEQEVLLRLAVSHEEIVQYFSAHRKDFSKPEEVRVRQIVTRTQEEAERLRRDILKGASFEELARQHSLGPEASEGGDLGYFPRGRMPPSIDEVCFQLVPSRCSQVVASSYGFHLFKLVNKRPARDLTLEEATDEIERKLLEQKGKEAEQEYLQHLHANAKIERNLNLLDRIH
jgi:peptidyl-prolyl cis-trans isomerase C